VPLAYELLRGSQEHPRNDSTIMDAFSPEFAQHWLASQASVDEEHADGWQDDALSPAQQEALEELAERVSAARRVY